MRLLFCLFADSVGLLPRHLFRNLVRSDDRFLPRKFLRKLKALFEAMSEPDGIFGEHTIKYFNGGLFDSSSVIELDTTDLGILYEVTSNFDWSHVAPEIFGTLFERSLNAERRSLIGAHYTSAEDILLLIEPVLMRPLEQRWAEVQSSILTLLNPGAHPDEPTPLSANGAPTSQPGAQPQETSTRQNQGLKARPKTATQPLSLLSSNPDAESLLAAWIDELTSIRVLDPACGSGNFLYLALRRLLDLWLEAQRFAAANDISMVLPKMVSPGQLYGIETEFYAHELASIVVWIGFLQWKHEHGIPDDREPILQKLTNIEHADAILRYDADHKSAEHPNGQPYEPTWPPADVIIGNPPFLGGKLLRRELGDTYVDDLFALYKGRVKAESDLVVYWFEKARAQLEAGSVNRVGLLATQAIRGGANRAVLERIQQTGTIFWAWSDRKWLLTGAAVRVSMIAFERSCTEPSAGQPPHTSVERGPTSKEPSAGGAPYTSVGRSPTSTASQNPQGPEARPIAFFLDGQPVPFINPDLTTGSNSASALPLKENAGLSFIGDQKGGSFELTSQEAAEIVRKPVNPNGKSNYEVIRPWLNGSDITGRARGLFIIDFGVDMPQAQAALFEAPFERVRTRVYPSRQENRRAVRKEKWWLHHEPMPAMRSATDKLSRFIVTPRVSKHRVFIWANAKTIPDSRLAVFARQDDYFFGVLHSTAHETWSLATSSRHGVADDITYNGASCFDTFPFPYPPGTEPTEADSPIVRAIADAARELVRLRDAWLNPPNASEADLKDRTLTKLYNARPEWLANAHRTLDRAVFAAYNWPLEFNGQDLTDQDLLASLLALNHQRAAIKN